MQHTGNKQKLLLRINVVNVSYWLSLVILTIPHLKTAYFTRIPTLDLLFNILKITSFIIIVFWYIIKRKPVPLLIILMVVWRAFLVYSTLVNDGEVYKSITESFSIISVALLYDISYSNGDTRFLSTQLFCFELVIYINLLTEILFPNGMYKSITTIIHTENWFLGYYNNHSQFYIPALMFAWLYWAKTGKLFRPTLLTAVIYVSAILVWSGGVLMSLVIMTIVFLFLKNRTMILNYTTYWLLHIVFFVSMYVFRIQDWFDWLLSGILGKMSSLMFRIDLWGRVLKLIEKSPIIGFGYQNVYVRTAEVQYAHGVHAHNMLLELIYQGGLIGLTLFICIILVAGRKLMKYSDTRESKIISTAFLGWCVATLVEPFTTPFLIGMFVIAHNSNHEETLANRDVAVDLRRYKLRSGYALR